MQYFGHDITQKIEQKINQIFNENQEQSFAEENHDFEFKDENLEGDDLEFSQLEESEIVINDAVSIQEENEQKNTQKSLELKAKKNDEQIINDLQRQIKEIQQSQ